MTESSGAKRLSSRVQLMTTEAGTAMSACLFSSSPAARSASRAAMTCTVFPSPMSSAMMEPILALMLCISQE